LELAFYYHTPVVLQQGKILAPGYIGVFIDALASEVDSLTLLMHESIQYQPMIEDYTIKASNIRFISLGKNTPAWYRHVFHRQILKNKMKQIINVDLLLVRSPTPLAPFFKSYAGNCKPVFLIVGDYLESVKQMTPTTLRDKLIKRYLQWNDALFRKQIRTTDIIVNSPKLFTTYQAICKSIQQIKTTTLSASHIVERKDVCQGASIELLYTGRIDLVKGLHELLDAFFILAEKYPNMNLNFVGWEDFSHKPIENELKQKVKAKNLEHRVVFHGKKSIGVELNAMYQQADFYIIPSYHEGFPRTIWEAMANGLPVIATTVGAIPAYLTHRENAILIEPKQVTDIVDAVELLLQDVPLRQRIIQNAFELVKENTLEKQTKLLVEKLESLL